LKEFHFPTITLFAFTMCVLATLGTALMVMLYAAMWHSFNSAVPAIGFADSVYTVGALCLVSLPLGVARKRS